MLNYIWFGLIVVGFLFGAMNGKIDLVTKATMEGALSAVELCIGLLGILCLWSGLMNIAQKSGLVDRIAQIARPILKVLFPKIPDKHPAMASIVMNMAANFFGLGNAATPLGIAAMGELQKLNPRKHVATDEMCMFLVVNTAAFQLIPATIIAVRSSAGASNPADITVPIWFASICATIAGVAAVKLLSSLENQIRH